MEATPGTRLHQWREFKGLSMTEMFRLTGIKVSTLSTAEQPGSSNPSYDTITKALQAFPDLSPDWLLLGTGPMLRDGRALTQAPRPEPAPDYTSAAGTIDATVNILLKEQIADLRKQNQQLLDMLGKSPGSSDAADSFPSHPLPVPQLRVQARRGRIGFRVGKGR